MRNSFDHLSLSIGDLDNMRDEVLVERLLATKHHRFFEEIFRRHKKFVYLKALMVLRDPAEAEDIAQETFLKLFDSLDDFRGGDLAAWLGRVARNLSVNRLLARLRNETAQSRNPIPLAFESRDRDLSMAEQVRAILAELPSHQRVPMKLFYIEGYTYKQIAAKLKYSEEQVKSFLQNGKRQFRIKWEQMNSFPKAAE